MSKKKNKVSVGEKEILLEKNDKEKTYGVVLCAIGSPYYSHMAYTLAVSLRFHTPSIHITLLHDGSSLSQISEYLDMFDNIVQLTDEQFNTNGQKDYFKFKLYLDKLTPYDKTLYLDVDMIWNPTKTPEFLFKELDGIGFTISNRGITQDSLLSQWTSLKEVRELYSIDKIYDISSEFMYFEGKPEVFSKAREVYNENKIVIKIPILNNKYQDHFGEGKPDEIYLSVAMALTKTKPHQSPWHPTYWQPFHFKKVYGQQYIQSHYATSTGGAWVQHNIKKIYDNLGNHYYNRMGVKKHFYQLMAKSKIVKGRRQT